MNFIEGKLGGVKNMNIISLIYTHKHNNYAD